MKSKIDPLAIFLLSGTLALTTVPAMAYEVAYLRLTGTLLSVEDGNRRGVIRQDICSGYTNTHQIAILRTHLRPLCMNACNHDPFYSWC